MEQEVFKKLRYKKGNATVVNAPEGFKLDIPTEQHLDGKFDFILLFVCDAKELHEWAPKAIDALNGDAVFWICYPKKSSKVKTDINRDIVWKILLDTTEYRLVSNVAIDETWSALRVRHQNTAKSK